MQSKPLRSWKLGPPLHKGSQVLSPKYDKDAYVATCLEGEARDFHWDLGQAKSWAQRATQVPRCFV